MTDPSSGDVVRRPRPTRPERPRRRVLVAVGSVAVVVTLLLGALVLWWPGSEHRASTASTTSVATTTTTADVGTGPVAPLTGEPVQSGHAADLGRPALAVKVDGASEAMPQASLDEADIVVEEKVEGISRYMAVYHSRTPAEVGPVRSARTTDLDLLGGFGAPLLAYSGGNATVLKLLHAADWIVSAGPDDVRSAYHRAKDRTAPHNLIADPEALWGALKGGKAPAPVFTYRPDGVAAPGGPVPGVAVSVGSDARFVWSDGRHGWLRWARGRPHDSPAGTQLAPANVVVAQVRYVPSKADARSPEAITVGSGPAWVLSDGNMAAGTWSRPDRASPWALTDAQGAALALTPGTTWLVLADAPPTVLTKAAADALQRR